MVSCLNHHISGLTLYHMPRYWWQKCLLPTSLPDYVRATFKYPAALLTKLYTRKCSLWHTKRGTAPETVINEVHVYGHRVTTFLVGLNSVYSRRVQDNHDLVEPEGFVTCMLKPAKIICGELSWRREWTFCDTANGMFEFLIKCAGSSTCELIIFLNNLSVVSTMFLWVETVHYKYCHTLTSPDYPFDCRLSCYLVQIACLLTFWRGTFFFNFSTPCI